MDRTTDKDSDREADAGRTYPENRSPGLFENAVGRTDNRFSGKKPREDLIGQDIPDDEQDAEEEERS